VNHAKLAQRLVLAAAALAPTAAVLLVRAVAPHAGPASASARPGAPDRVEPVHPLTPAPLTGKQPALAAAIRSRTPEFRSPFVVPMSEADREGLLQNPKGKAPPPKAPEFAVTSIISGAQTFAVINGKPRRVGDELDGGWVLAEIDSAGRRATVEHPEQGRLVLKIKTELE